MSTGPVFCSPASLEAAQIVTESVDDRVVKVSVSRVLRLCTKVSILLIQHFSDQSWIGGMKFDDLLTIPKNRSQIKRALGISNNLY